MDVLWEKLGDFIPLAYMYMGWLAKELYLDYQNATKRTKRIPTESDRKENGESEK